MIEKIDVIDNIIYIYNVDMGLIKSINLDDLSGLDLTYLDGAKLFTLNLTNPIKRVVKFSEINSLDTQAVFTETIYENMTEQQKLDIDNFILLINSFI